MMTAEELYEAAREELGGDRVEKLKRVNVEAARRIAEYQASLIQSNANSTHNRQGVDQATRVVVPTTSAERHTEEPRAEISAVEETSMNPITSSEESVEAPDDIGTGDADETTSSEGMEDGVEAEGTTTENLDTRN